MTYSQSPIKQREQEARERARAKTVKVFKIVAVLVLPALGVATLALGGLAALSSGSAETRALEAREQQAQARAQAEADLDEAVQQRLEQAFRIAPDKIAADLEVGKALLPGAQDIEVVRSVGGSYIVTGLGRDGSQLSVMYDVVEGEAVERKWVVELDQDQDQQDPDHGEQEEVGQEPGDDIEENDV